MGHTLHVRYIEQHQPYEAVWRAMQDFTAQRTPSTTDELWLLQHEPVYTLGQAGDPQHLLHATNTPLVRTDRGGQITWHGPGQLMAYTLLDTQRLRLGPRALVRHLEHAIVDTLAPLGIQGIGNTAAPGVYVTHSAHHAKIAAIGLRLRKQGCYHGAALNLDCDLSAFHHINPCGHTRQAVTRVADLTDKPWSTAQIGTSLAHSLAQQLGYTQLIVESFNTLSGVA